MTAYFALRAEVMRWYMRHIAKSYICMQVDIDEESKSSDLRLRLILMLLDLLAGLVRWSSWEVSPWWWMIAWLQGTSVILVAIIIIGDVNCRFNWSLFISLVDVWCEEWKWKDFWKICDSGFLRFPYLADVKYPNLRIESGILETTSTVHTLYLDCVQTLTRIYTCSCHGGVL